ALVRGLQRPRGVLHQPQRLVRVERTAGDDGRQRLAAHQLHHQVRRAPAVRALVLAVVVHRRDARVVQRGDGARLDAEAVQELRVVAQLRAQHLDRDAAAQPGVGGFPDLAHAADGDAALEQVAVVDLLTRGEDGHRSRPNAARITARPIGAATVPPVAARLLRSPPDSTSTATATCGSSAGANATYQTCGATACGLGPCSAVPVFAAICTPVILPLPE